MMHSLAERDPLPAPRDVAETIDLWWLVVVAVAEHFGGAVAIPSDIVETLRAAMPREIKQLNAAVAQEFVSTEPGNKRKSVAHDYATAEEDKE